MDYIFIIISSVVVISCFYFIVAPFFSNERMKVENKNETDETDLPVNMIYSAVNELEMDFLMKKISQEDFQTMKAEYHALAAGYLKTEQNKKITETTVKKAVKDETDREILKELNKLRNSKTKKRNE